MQIFREFLRPIPTLAFTLLWLLHGAAVGGETFCSHKERQFAAAAVASAEAKIALAAERKALWTVAVDAVARARESFRAGDCGQAISEAEAAIALSQLGIEQREYSPYQIP